MNEFAWRRQLRALRQPHTPSRDLWGAIDAALDNAEPVDAPARPTTPRLRALRRQHWLVAASVVAAVALAGGLGWRLLHTPTPALANSAAPAPAQTPAQWKPADPRLLGAAIELGAARAELQQALEQAPASPALQRLLSRTEQQQAQLRQLAQTAG